MSERRFKTGDVVHLNSGGPAMTIELYIEGSVDCTAWCVWQDADGDPQRHAFPDVCLRLAPPKEQPS